MIKWHFFSNSSLFFVHTNQLRFVNIAQLFELIGNVINICLSLQNTQRVSEKGHKTQKSYDIMQCTLHTAQVNVLLKRNRFRLRCRACVRVSVLSVCEQHRFPANVIYLSKRLTWITQVKSDTIAFSEWSLMRKGETIKSKSNISFPLDFTICSFWGGFFRCIHK